MHMFRYNTNIGQTDRHKCQINIVRQYMPTRDKISLLISDW